MSYFLMLWRTKCKFWPALSHGLLIKKVFKLKLDCGSGFFIKVCFLNYFMFPTIGRFAFRGWLFFAKKIFLPTKICFNKNFLKKITTLFRLRFKNQLGDKSFLYIFLKSESSFFIFHWEELIFDFHFLLYVWNSTFWSVF